MTTPTLTLARTAWAAIRYARMQAIVRRRTERQVCRETIDRGRRAVAAITTEAKRP